MSLQKGKRRKSRPESSSETTLTQPSRFPSWLFPFALGAVIVGSGVFLAMHQSAPGTTSDTTIVTPAITNSQRGLPSLGELALMPENELAKQDIALDEFTLCRRVTWLRES